MPKSKRNKTVPLTVVKKKDKDWKQGIIAQVRGCVEEYPTVYLFAHSNFRNDKFKQLREELRESSRFCLGSNRVLRVALGCSPADECRPNISELAVQVRGSVGLLFTRLPRAMVARIAEDFQHVDFARAGSTASEDFVLETGPVLVGGEPIAHTLEPSLRKNGLPTKLTKGVVLLTTDYVVCHKGDVLRSQQTALLRHFGVKMAVFRIKLLGVWENNAYEQLAEGARVDSGIASD